MRRRTSTALLILACGCAAPAHAQVLNSLKGAAGIGGGGGGGGLAMPQVGSASSGNIAGVLQYCMRNNYLGGGGAQSTESGLLGKLGGGATSSSQYESGSQGQLQTGGGRSFSLAGNGDSTGGGLKAKLTQKVCDQVLKHAKSLL